MSHPPYALDQISSEQVKLATSLVQAGRVYDLGLDLSLAIPQGPAGEFEPFAFRWTHQPDLDASDEEYQYSAEAITCTPHIGTHMDGLMHVSSGRKTFGGGDVAELTTAGGFAAYGMETVPPIVTRAVIFDVAGRHGAVLPDSYEVTPADLEAHDLTVHSGDAVLVRTGKIREFGVDNDAYQRSQPGVGRDAAIWLYERGMAVLGTDTTGTEPLPFKDPSSTTHQAMLVERGVHLLENLNLEELAADDVAHAMFVCLPLRITGATGSWIRPIAIV